MSGQMLIAVSPVETVGLCLHPQCCSDAMSGFRAIQASCVLCSTRFAVLYCSDGLDVFKVSQFVCHVENIARQLTWTHSIRISNLHSCRLSTVGLQS